MYFWCRASSFYSQVGLALSTFSLDLFQESYEIYKSCFHWLADKDGLKSDVLVAMGSLAYKAGGDIVFNRKREGKLKRKGEEMKKNEKEKG